jgi:hypothetical protein
LRRHTPTRAVKLLKNKYIEKERFQTSTDCVTVTDVTGKVLQIIHKYKEQTANFVILFISFETEIRLSFTRHVITQTLT